MNCLTPAGVFVPVFVRTAWSVEPAPREVTDDVMAIATILCTATHGPTLMIQNESDGKYKEANWLPASTGPSFMTTRLSWAESRSCGGHVDRVAAEASGVAEPLNQSQDTAMKTERVKTNVRKTTLKIKTILATTLVCAMTFVTSSSFMVDRASGQETVQLPADEVAIRSTVAAYLEAYNKHDAQALADLWSPDAVYTNRLTGEEVVGRAAIAEQFAAIFKAQPDLKLDVNPESIKLLSPNAAIEYGTIKLLSLQEEPEEVKYTAIYVKRDGRWLLDRVTDGTEEEEAPSHYEQLKALEWMVGTWVDEDEAAQIETEVKWTKNRNFLTRSFSITVGDRIDMSGMQFIGWDASTKTIRSWTFDSDGGFAEGTWTYKQDRWFIRNKGVLADGRAATAVNVIKPVDANSFTWQTTERTAGGELLPNIDEVRIARK